MALSIIEEIQRDSLNPLTRTSDLLRKAKVVAAKLDLPDLLAWVDSELGGYEAEVPDYRIVGGRPCAMNPYRGWIPIILPTDDLQRKISMNAVTQSIASLEPLVIGKGTVQFPFPPALVNWVNQGMHVHFGQMALLVDRSQVVGILEAVRTTVLEWSLKLEKAGITGNGYSFSLQEKEIAHQQTVNISIGSIGNFAGHVGSATGGAIVNAHQTVGLDISRTRQLVDQVEKVLPVAELGVRQEESARELVAGLRAELSKPAPDQNTVRSMLGMLKRAMEGAASKIIADGIISNIDQVL